MVSATSVASGAGGASSPAAQPEPPPSATAAFLPPDPPGTRRGPLGGLLPPEDADGGAPSSPSTLRQGRGEWSTKNGTGGGGRRAGNRSHPPPPPPPPPRVPPPPPRTTNSRPAPHPFARTRGGFHSILWQFVKVILIFKAFQAAQSAVASRGGLFGEAGGRGGRGRAFLEPLVQDPATLVDVSVFLVLERHMHDGTFGKGLRADARLAGARFAPAPPRRSDGGVPPPPELPDPVLELRDVPLAADGAWLREHLADLGPVDLDVSLPAAVLSGDEGVAAVARWRLQDTDAAVSTFLDHWEAVETRSVLVERERGNLLRMTEEERQRKAEAERRRREAPTERGLFWRPRVSLGTIDEFSTLRLRDRPAYSAQLRTPFPAGRLVDASGGRFYFPLTAMESFWLLGENMVRLDQEVDEGDGSVASALAAWREEDVRAGRLTRAEADALTPDGGGAGPPRRLVVLGETTDCDRGTKVANAAAATTQLDGSAAVDAEGATSAESASTAATAAVDVEAEGSADAVELDRCRRRTVPLRLVYRSGISPWQTWLSHSLAAGLRNQERAAGLSSRESDEIKRIFVVTNPWYLGLTMTVSLVHTLFDLLAFSSDVGFWSKNKSMEGLSAGAVVGQAGMQAIVFLYLLDNDTSFLVLMSVGLGLVVELWKLTRVFVVRFRWPTLGNPLPLSFTSRASSALSDTARHDRDAMVWLSRILLPCLVVYAAYDLYSGSHHTSWYSWTLSTLVGAVYLFGFVLMCPQLYLNYRLKSVAHLPWRQMTYKALNTVIDDLFAFCIKMPTLHRLAVFRDDVVFACFLYQRWIYPIDRTRVNEFGFSETAGATVEGVAAIAGAATALTETAETAEMAMGDADADAPPGPGGTAAEIAPAAEIVEGGDGGGGAVGGGGMLRRRNGGRRR